MGNREAMLNHALTEMSLIVGVSDVVSSNFYQTTPVSSIPQNDYLNAVCTFKSSRNPKDLFDELEKIERMLGKSPKPKNEPRIIDLDLLFFGVKSCRRHGLEIPHPRWQERLFVLIPLLDLTKEFSMPDSCNENRIGQFNMMEMVAQFPRQQKKSVTYYSNPRNFKVKS